MYNLRPRAPSISSAALFKSIREALGMSQDDMQMELCMLDVLTVQRMENSELDVYGTTWVAIWNLIQDRLGEIEEGVGQGDKELLEKLCDQVEIRMENIREAALARKKKIQQQDSRYSSYYR